MKVKKITKINSKIFKYPKEEYKKKMMYQKIIRKLNIENLNGIIIYLIIMKYF